MRIWDDENGKPRDPRLLCRQHLLGVHNEAGCIFNIHTKGLNGFRNHPEVKRWAGHLPALKRVHDEVAEEVSWHY